MIVDSLIWHDMAFIRAIDGYIWLVRLTPDGWPEILKLAGNEPEFYEPLAELRMRASRGARP